MELTFDLALLLLAGSVNLDALKELRKLVEDSEKDATSPTKTQRHNYS